MFAPDLTRLKGSKLKTLFAACAAGLGIMAASLPAEARGGMGGGFHGGGRGFGHFRNPVVFMHPRPFRSPFLNNRGFVSRQFFFRRRFADNRRFFLRRDRFVGPFAFGFDGAPYTAWPYDPAYPTSTAPSYDSAYPTSPDDQGASPSYNDPYNVSGASGGGCSLLIKLEKSGDHLVVSRIPLCNSQAGFYLTH